LTLTVVIITKNEALNLPRALASIAFADEVVIFDSGSTDGTQTIARKYGARVFETLDWPGYGTQKNRAIEKATGEWILSLDADEWVEQDLREQIQQIVGGGETHAKSVVAYRFPRRSIFIDRTIRFGDWRRDKVTRLFRNGRAKFSEDEVHERLVVDGQVSNLRGHLGHHTVKSIEDSLEKMFKYNKLAANKIASENRGGVTKGVLKGIFSLLRALILRAGFLDGKRGIQLAWFNAYGTFLRYSIAQSVKDQHRFRSREYSKFQKIRDLWSLFIVDHGFLRILYHNRWRVLGGLYRANQPSPGRLRVYKEKFAIRTVVNLRGENDQLGWYRLEEQACRVLGIHLINIQVYSRGLVSGEKIIKLREIISSLELPALVHCKSGADRAGFFTVLYRHYRLGEPIEHAVSELSIKYGHSKSAKTGVLDHFFRKYIDERSRCQSFTSWATSEFNLEETQNSFRAASISDWIIDRLMRRE